MNDDARNGDDDEGEAHSRKSLEFTATQVEQMALEIRSLLALLPAECDGLTVPRESSRKNGIKRLRSWADALRDSVHAATLDSLKTVSASRDGSDKPRKKKS
jgi:hypothetical protein